MPKFAWEKKDTFPPGCMQGLHVQNADPEIQFQFSNGSTQGASPNTCSAKTGKLVWQKWAACPPVPTQEKSNFLFENGQLWTFSMFSSICMMIICNHLEISIFHMSWLWCMYNADPAPYALLHVQFQCPSFLCTDCAGNAVQRNDGHWNSAFSGAHGAGSALYIHHSQLMWKILISKWLHMIIIHMELNIEVLHWHQIKRRSRNTTPCVHLDMAEDLDKLAFGGGGGYWEFHGGNWLPLWWEKWPATFQQSLFNQYS